MKNFPPRNDKGQLHGLWEMCYSDGSIGYKRFYNNGNRVGYEEYYSWYKKGNKLSHKTYNI